MNALPNIREYLLNKQKDVAKKIKNLDEEDSSLAESSPESQELGTFSWEADTNSTRAAIKEQLKKDLKNLEISLLKISKGTYGECENCKGQIEEGRLNILPTANLCVRCLN